MPRRSGRAWETDINRHHVRPSLIGDNSDLLPFDRGAQLVAVDPQQHRKACGAVLIVVGRRPLADPRPNPSEGQKERQCGGRSPA